jgi:site-specific DNA-methyltransferase (adenine-specific)
VIESDGQAVTLFDPIVLTEGESDARAQLQRIKGHWQAFWFELKDFHDRRLWLALGYESGYRGFLACVKAELDIGPAHAYRLIEAAGIREELGIIPGDNASEATERQLRELKPLPAPVRLEIAQRIDFAATPVRELRQIVKQAKAEIAVKVEERRAAEPPKPIPLMRLPSDVTLTVADAAALPLPDGCIDLVVTSPPYGLDVAYHTEDSAAEWPAKMARWLTEMYRVTREHGRLAINVPLDATSGGFRPTYHQAVGAALAAGWVYRASIVWAENNVSKSNGRGSVDSAACPHVIAPVEMVALFSRGEWKRETDAQSDLGHDDWLTWTNGLWAFNGESHAWEGHPAPFPEELPERLIKLLSFPGDTVLDPFLGSGTTAVVAHRLGRKCYGYDLSAEYIDSAKRRLGRLD